MIIIIRRNVVVYRDIDQETGKTRLYCHSEQKAKKEQGIRNRFYARLEEALKKLHTGLSKKGTLKKYDKILERIGRLRQKHSRVAADYTINVIADDKKTKPPVSNGNVNLKVTKKISTVVFTA